MLQTFFTQRALKGKLGTPRAIQGHCKGTRRTLERHLGTRALGHSRHLGTWALEDFSYSDTQKALRHWGTHDTWALGNSGTWVLGHSGTRTTLEHSNIRGTLFSRICFTHYLVPGIKLTTGDRWKPMHLKNTGEENFTFWKKKHGGNERNIKKPLNSKKLRKT